MSSSTVFMFSIQTASTGPSKTIHFLWCVVLEACSRNVFARIPVIEIFKTCTFDTGSLLKFSFFHLHLKHFHYVYKFCLFFFILVCFMAHQHTKGHKVARQFKSINWMENKSHMNNRLDKCEMLVRIWTVLSPSTT